MQRAIRDQKILNCTEEDCGAPVKPNIVFFGEQMPDAFMETSNQIESNVDLCLIMGTALAVAPFSWLPFDLADGVPQVLFNM